MMKRIKVFATLLFMFVSVSAPMQADELTELFTTGETRDLGTPFFFQWVLMPDGSADFYSACRTKVITPPVYPSDVDALTLSDDGSQTIHLPLGVTLPFFGTSYSTLHINANGNISFGSADGSFTGDLATHFAQPRISAALTDLWPDAPGASNSFIGWRDLGDRVAVVYSKVPHRADVNDVTDVVIELLHSGPYAGQIRITSASLTPHPDVRDVVVGVSNGGGVPAGFVESDISAYPLCPAGPETAELFTGGGSESIDLSNTSLCFEFDSVAGYRVTRENNVTTFPTDPAGGNFLNLGDDGSAVITTSQSVSIHGTSYVDVGVNANGWLTFLSGNGDFTETLNEFFAQHAVAALWHDIDPSQGGTISWRETGAGDRVVVTWENVPDRNTGAPNSFQIEMYMDGSNRVVISYLSIGSTAGIVGLSSGLGATPVGFVETDFSAAPLKTPPPVNADYGDLPDLGIGQTFGDYATSFADGGPAHVIVSGVHLGVTADVDLDGQPNERANGDDVDGDGDDDDGVVFLHPLHEGFSSEIEVTAASPGFLNGWIDFDGDGVFTAGERVATDLFVNIGTNTIHLPPTPFVDVELLYSRFRFTADDPAGALGPDGVWGNGEVEDYALGSISGVAWLDDGTEGGIEGNGVREEFARVPDLPVALLRPGGVPVLDAAGNPVRTMTNGEGYYRFSGLSAGDYILQFEAGALVVTAPDQGGNDQVDSDIDGSGQTVASVIVDEGRAVRFVDAGYLPPVIEFQQTAETVAEAEAPLAVLLNLSGPLPVEVRVPFIVGGTASEPGDYSALAGEFVIPANTTVAGPFAVAQLHGDTLDEADETLVVALGAPSFGRLGTKTVFTATIIDDDDPPVVTVAATSADENVAGGMILFTISIDVPSGQDITVNYTTLADTADEDSGSGGDYTLTTGTATILAGQTQVTVGVPVFDDALDEDNETLRLVLTGATNATFAPGELGVGLIIDDDLPPNLTIADSSSVEGTNAAFWLMLDAPSGREVVVELATIDGTAGAADYVGFSSLLVTFPKGDIFRSINVSVLSDALIEAEETYTVITLSTPSVFYQGAPTAIGRIIDEPTMINGGNMAWSAAVGWQNWLALPYTGVVVGETILTGYVWCSNTGWLHLGSGAPVNGVSYSNAAANDYGVNHAPDGKLTGKGWSPTTGWLVFEQVHGKAAINRKTGEFSGHAWSATTGWLCLDGLRTGEISIVDSDGDGIDDGWERTNFGNSLAVAGASTDADGDGASDKDEWISGTDPNDGADYLHVSSQSRNGNQITLTFPTDPNRRYSIDISADLSPLSWHIGELGVFDPDPGSTTTKTITMPAGRRYFFRVRSHTLINS